MRGTRAHPVRDPGGRRPEGASHELSCYRGTLPTRREAVRGHLADGRETYLIFGISRKLYTCQRCNELMQVGTEHAVVRHLLKDGGGYDHHHVHVSCCREEILPVLRDPKIVAATEARTRKINAKARRLRGRLRRRQRRG